MGETTVVMLNRPRKPTLNEYEEILNPIGARKKVIVSAENRLLARVLVVKENLVVKSDSCNVHGLQSRTLLV